MWQHVFEALAIAQGVAALLTLSAILLDRHLRPSSAMTWILLILTLPVLGVLLFWTVGKPWLSRRRRRNHDRMLEELGTRMSTTREMRQRNVRTALGRMPDGTRSLAVLAGQISGLPPVGGNEVEFFGATDELLDRMIADIDAATNHVHAIYYIALADEGGQRVMDAMQRAAKRGVAVRFLADSIGSRPFFGCDSCRKLLESGVKVAEALPAGLVRAFFQRIDLRNHRKILIVDGGVGYIGSHNLASADFKMRKKRQRWVDATARIEGPGANELQRVFIEDWYVETEEELHELIANTEPTEGGVVTQVVSTGPTTPEDAMPEVIATCFHLAQKELVVSTPYFVPDESTIVSLITAARRGVKVTLAVPDVNDSRLVKLASQSFFQRLLDGGIDVRVFQDGMLHAKTITIDDRLSVITSANLDRRSFEINFEVSLLIYDAGATAAMRRLQDSYIERSVKLDRDTWMRRPWWNRLIENAAGLTSPVL